jgi:hypothetical protein
MYTTDYTGCAWKEWSGFICELYKKTKLIKFHFYYRVVQLRNVFLGHFEVHSVLNHLS